MNPEIKTGWIERLRSGEYKQGKNVLKQIEDFGNGPEVHHCCLGVLCDMAEEAGVVVSGEPDGWAGTVWFGDDYELLPSEVAEWAGMDNSDGRLVEDTALDAYEYDGGFYDSVAEMNDKGLTFKEIADIIEKEF